MEHLLLRGKTLPKMPEQVERMLRVFKSLNGSCDETKAVEEYYRIPDERMWVKRNRLLSGDVGREVHVEKGFSTRHSSALIVDYNEIWVLVPRSPVTESGIYQSDSGQEYTVVIGSEQVTAVCNRTGASYQVAANGSVFCGNAFICKLVRKVRV